MDYITYENKQYYSKNKMHNICLRFAAVFILGSLESRTCEQTYILWLCG